MPRTHKIQQQHLHVKLKGGEPDGLALQARLSGICNTWLSPALEQVLERYAPLNGHLAIDRLDIDVGVLRFDRLEHELVDTVTQALEKILRDLSLPGQELPVAGAVQLKTARQSCLDAFVYFLSYGRLPWSFRVPKGENLEQILVESWQTCPLDVPGAISSVLALSSARKRLVQQFSDEFLANLLEQFAPGLKKTITGILQRLNHSEIPASAIKLLKKQLWETAFALLPTSGDCTETRIIRTAWQGLPLTVAQQSLLTRLLEQHWPGATGDAEERRSLQHSGKTSDTSPRFSRPIQAGRRNLPAQAAVPGTDNLAGNHPGPVDGIVPKNGRPDPQTKAAFNPGNSAAVARADKLADEYAETGEGIYIENAGLILLHPFLPQFFSGLNIAAEDAIVDAGRALSLLYFLTSGQLTAPEYELVLPKLLCNIPLSAVIEADAELTDAEIEEAIALLGAVIRHWEVLKNTGIDGLRGTFLLRAGKISLRGDGDWCLQVEGKAYDILLEQLPWGIGMIKLPWMQRMLWVEWDSNSRC